MSQPYNVRRTLARLRLQRMAMRREGKLLTQGHRITPSAATDVRATWAKHGWEPVRG